MPKHAHDDGFKVKLKAWNNKYNFALFWSNSASMSLCAKGMIYSMPLESQY